MIAAAPASSKQIGAIHAAKARLGLDEDSYRDVLQSVAGKRSAKELSASEAWQVMERFKAWTNPTPTPAAGKPAAAGALRLEGTYAGVCRALWMAGWNLGIVQDRTDRALVAFVARQTGIASLNWVHDGKDAAKVIEALKAWIDREAGGITWEVKADTLKRWGYTLTRWRKVVVIRAQIDRLAQLGEHNVQSFAQLGVADERTLDEIQSELGRKLRKALARRRPSPAPA